jgi:hypothetical protein
MMGREKVYTKKPMRRYERPLDAAVKKVIEEPEDEAPVVIHTDITSSTGMSKTLPTIKKIFPESSAVEPAAEPDSGIDASLPEAAKKMLRKKQKKARH